MKRPYLVHSALLSLAVTGACAVESNDPAPFPQTRYAAMAEQSPFALATPVAPPTTPMVSFAQGWHLTGITKVSVDNVPTDRVTVVTAENRSFSLTGSDEKDGVSISNVAWSSKVGFSTVTLKKGTEFATVEFSHEAAPAGPRLQVPVALPAAAGHAPANTSHVLVPRPNLPLPNPNGAAAPAPVNRHAQRFIEAPATR